MAKLPNISFNISGPALSFLYYDCDKSRMDQMGFLIGKKHTYIKKTISDSELNAVENETVYNINASLAVGLPFKFCDNLGRIDTVKLKKLLGPLEKDVCGWYIFRRNSGLNPLLRGTILHRELMACLPHITPELFTLCCIGNETNTSKSTHRYKHVFLIYANRSFLPISVPITNLGQTLDNSYRTLSTSSTSVNKIINCLKFGDDTDGLSIMKALQKPLQERINQITKRLHHYDELTQKLQNEVQGLKEMKYKKLVMEEDIYSSPERKSSNEDSNGATKSNENDETAPLLFDASGDGKEINESEDSEDVVASSQKSESVEISIISHNDYNRSLNVEKSQEY